MTEWTPGFIPHEYVPIFGKSPDEILPGDSVIPDSGRYKGVQCEVKDVLRPRPCWYELKVVPTIPVADDLSVGPGRMKDREWPEVLAALLVIVGVFGLVSILGRWLLR